MNHIDFINRGATTLNDDSPFDMIPTFTIDQLELPVCDLIWLDVEGYEGEVLTGAQETIDRTSPFLIVVETANDVVKKILEKYDYHQIDVSVSDKVWAKGG